MEEKRNLTIDLIKGIGIFMMVYRHARGPFSVYVVLFHMAIFFIASGFLFNPRKLSNHQDLKCFIIRKIKSLWFPYFSFTVAYILLNNIFLKLNIYTNNSKFLLIKNGEYLELGRVYSVKLMFKEIIKAMFFQSNTQIGGALWFFGTLFFTINLYAIIYFFVNKLTKKCLLVQFFFSIAFLLIGYACSLNNLSLWGFGRVFSVYYLIFLGNVIKEYNIMEKINNNKRYVLSIVFCVILFLIGENVGSISIVGNSYFNPIYFIAMSITGWIYVWCISQILLEIDLPIHTVLKLISRHSVAIIAMHFLCFKIINLIEVICFNYEYYRIAQFPVLVSDGGWWILYTTVGIIIPLVIDTIIKNIFCNKGSIR